MWKIRRLGLELKRISLFIRFMVQWFLTIVLAATTLSFGCVFLLHVSGRLTKYTKYADYADYCAKNNLDREHEV